MHGRRGGDTSVRLCVSVALAIYRRRGGEPRGELQGDGGHAGGCGAGGAEGQGHRVDRPAGGVGPLQSGSQDRKTAFSQDGGEEGEPGERGPVPGGRGLGAGGGREALTGGEAGLRDVHQAGAGRQKVPLDGDNSGGEDAREDRGAGGDSAAESSDGGRLHGGPAALSVRALGQDGLSGGGRGGEQVCCVCGARSVL